MKPKMKRRYLEELSVILCIVSIVLLASSINNTSAFSENDVLGLVQKLNIGYWLGLAFILTSLLLLISSDNVRNKKHEKLFLFEACFLALYLYAVAALAESNLYFPDTWGHAGSAMSVLVYGTSTHPGVTWYASCFPGAFILHSALALITNTSFSTLTKYYPVLFSLSVVPISYMLLRRFFSDARTVYLATVFLVSGSVWVFQKWYCPNSIAFLWYMLILYFAFSQPTKKATGLSFLLGLAAIFTNPTTIPFLIFSLMSIWIGLKLFERLGISGTHDILVSHRLFLFSFILLLSVSWLAWLEANASGVIYVLIFALRKFSLLGPTERVVMISPVLQSGVTFKLVYSLLFAVGGVVGVFYLFWRLLRRSKTENGLLFLAIGWAVGCFVLGLITGFFQGGEFYERALLYSFVPSTVLAFTIFKNRHGKAILLLIILIGAPLSLFAAYSNESFEYSPISDSYGAMFMANHNITNVNSINGSYPTRDLVQFYILQWCYRHNITPDLQPSNFKFFVWSQTSERFYVNYVEGRNYSLVAYQSFTNPNITQGFNLLYDGGGFRLYSVSEGAQKISGIGG